MIAIALIGAFTLYSEQKHQSLAQQGKNIFRNDIPKSQSCKLGTPWKPLQLNPRS